MFLGNMINGLIIRTYKILCFLIGLKLPMLNLSNIFLFNFSLKSMFISIDSENHCGLLMSPETQT